MKVSVCLRPNKIETGPGARYVDAAASAVITVFDWVQFHMPALALLAFTSIFSVQLFGGVAGAAEYESLGEVRRGIAEGSKTMHHVGESVITVVFDKGAVGLDRKLIHNWIDRSADAVTAYFGRFPVDAVTILIVSETGARVGHATTWGYDESTIRIFVGRDADENALFDDWVLVHEMAHLALPRLPRHQQWALEGNATYIEPIARVQAGQIDAVKVWRGMVRDMPQGLPGANDRGLDQARSWRRTYWGGALFYFVADVEIHRRTANRAGLQDAMRAVNRASGGNGAVWTMERLIEIGDKATGTTVLAELYASMGRTAGPVELTSIFSSLGVLTGADGLYFSDEAPQSETRKALMSLH